MPKVKEYRQIRLQDLVIGKGQSRTRDVASGISELADSIKKIGLLQPIVVCQSAEQPGKYELLTGQRRFLAHQELGLTTIAAMVMDGPVNELEAKVISVTENVLRRDLNPRDAVDACTYLFKKYGSRKAVAEETGLPYPLVCQYVKYDSLVPELKKLYDDGRADLKTLLRAQAAAEQMSDDNSTIAKSAMVMAKEMAGMTSVQQQKLVSVSQNAEGKTVEEVIEQAKKGATVYKLIVELPQEDHKALQKFAKDEETSNEEAGLSLIEDGLKQRGLLA
jgi:ParB family chromosome partitioning protein